MSECTHGYLDRQCPYCEIDRLTAELAEARDLLRQFLDIEEHGSPDPAASRCALARRVRAAIDDARGSE
jgi:hypothetical protein